MSRVEWWRDTLLKQATVPAPLTVWPVGTCSINCCLHRACRLHALSIARIKETTHWTLWNFYSMCSLLFPFSSLSSYSYSPPWPPSPFLAPPPNRQERLLSAMFSARLPSCPEAVEYLVSSLTANISPLSARSKNLIGEGVGGIKRRKEKGGTTSRSLVGEILRRARWETVVSFSYSNYRYKRHTKEKIEMRGFSLPVDNVHRRAWVSS